MMSRLSAASASTAGRDRRCDREAVVGIAAEAPCQTIARPSAAAMTSPQTVPQATPATPQPRCRPSKIDRAILTPLSTSCSSRPSWPSPRPST